MDNIPTRMVGVNKGGEKNTCHAMSCLMHNAQHPYIHVGYGISLPTQKPLSYPTPRYFSHFIDPVYMRYALHLRVAVVPDPFPFFPRSNGI